MNRAAYAIARFYAKLALRNPATLFAMGGAIGYTVLTSMDEATRLQHSGLRLNLLEVMFQIFDNPLYTTFGLFVPFLIIVSPLFYIKDLERLIAYRASHRSNLWIAKVLAIVQITIVFLSTAFLIALAITALQYPVAFEWSDAYAQLAKSSTNPAERPDYRVANAYLYQTHNPLSVLVLQVLLFFASFVLVGVLSAVFAQIFQRPAVTLILVAMYWIVALAPAGMVPPVLTFLSPQAHLLLQIRSFALPFAVSFLYLVPTLVLSFLLGQMKTKRAILG